MKTLLINNTPEKPKTAAEWKKVFKLTNIGSDKICIGTYKEYGVSVTIPQMIGKRRVTKLEKTFSGDLNIKYVYLPESVEVIGSSVFSDCSALTQITLPQSITEIGAYAFRGCSSLIDITIPQGVVRIRNNAFQGCACITDISIPDSVRELGYPSDCWYFGNVFEGCIQIKNIRLSKKLTYIPDGAFKNCTSLKEVDLPLGITTIDRLAFANCYNLEKVSIPETVFDISRIGAFLNCNKLTIVTPKGSYAEQYAIEQGIPFVNY